MSGGAGKTAVLVYTMPLWLLPLAWWLLRERVEPLQWLAVATAAVGLGVLLEPWRGLGNAFSNLLAMGAGLAWACSVIVAKRLRARVHIDLLSLTAWQMLFGALALGLIAGSLSSRPITPTPYFLAGLAYNAVLATGIAWLLWLYILHHLPAGMAGLSSLGIPMIGLLAGWLELGERPRPMEFAGMLLIGCALVLVSIGTLRQARRQEPARAAPPRP